MGITYRGMGNLLTNFGISIRLFSTYSLTQLSDAS